MRRILLVAAAATSLVLAGCGGSDSNGGQLDDVKVSSAKSPKVTVDKGFKVEKTTTKVLKKGGGDALASGDAVKVNYVAVNGRTGKQFDSSFTGGRPLTLTLDKKAILPGFVTGLEGEKIGSRILVAIAPKDGFAEAQTQLDIKKSDTMVFLFDIVAKIPTEVTGTAAKLPNDVPTLKLDGDKHPSGFTKTSKTAKKVTKQSAHVVIKGKGAKITEGQIISAQYVGQIYPAGKVFDSSWARSAPTSFTLAKGQLIDCWVDGLTGQTVGSRVVLVCPSDVAYGKDGRAPDIKGGDTLIFAIDLLDAS